MSEFMGFEFRDCSLGFGGEGSEFQVQGLEFGGSG